MKYRAGDKVTVRAVVKYDQSDDTHVHLEIEGHYQSVMLAQKLITMATPLFEVGDDVSWDAAACQVGGGVILAISSEHAWIELGGGDYCTRMLSTLTRNEVPSDE